MTTFDFITDLGLRASLETDYRELTIAVSNSAWKATHVLAGSIIEALLVDYLLTLRTADAKGKDPLKMDLSELIAECRNLGILSDRTEHLSTVVRGYRNLIHPGRILRLGEQVDESSAQVAKALVDMIVKEVEAKRREIYGYTAEQVIDKVMQDASALSILPHLLKDMRPIEIERLLIHVFPAHYFACIAAYPEIYEPKEPSPLELELDRTMTSLVKCFHLAYESAPEAVRTNVAQSFVRILREERGANVTAYEDACFRCSELKYLSDADARMVVQHILARYSEHGGRGISALLRVIEGIGPYLTRADDGADLAQAICTAITQEPLWQFRNMLSDTGRAIEKEYVAMSNIAQTEFDQRWHREIELVEAKEWSQMAEILKELNNWWIPF